MFINFFYELKAAKVPVTLREYLTLMEAMKMNIAQFSVDEFYYLSRAALVKDERNLDKFDMVFAKHFKGLEFVTEDLVKELPEEWLRSIGERFLTDEEKEMIESMGGFEKLMEMLKKRLEEQKKKHEGGNKFIGTGGTAPFGADGYNPEGGRIGQKKGRHGRAVKVWDKRIQKSG